MRFNDDDDGDGDYVSTRMGIMIMANESEDDVCNYDANGNEVDDGDDYD